MRWFCLDGFASTVLPNGFFALSLRRRWLLVQGKMLENKKRKKLYSGRRPTSITWDFSIIVYVLFVSNDILIYFSLSLHTGNKTNAWCPWSDVSSRSFIVGHGTAEDTIGEDWKCHRKEVSHLEIEQRCGIPIWTKANNNKELEDARADDHVNICECAEDTLHWTDTPFRGWQNFSPISRHKLVG